MKKFLARKRSIAAAVLLLLAVTAGAVAFWTTTGTGTGTASTGTDEPVTITQTSSPTDLYPGGPAQPLSFTITNPADFDQRIASVTVAFDGTDKPGCGTADYEVAGSPVAVDQTIQAGATTAVITGATIKMLETGVNQDACKGATVSIEYTAS